MRSMLIRGMGGMGDCLHQRAIVRLMLQRYDLVQLETPWPCLYHDLAGPRLQLVQKATSLRTQRKNAAREAARFTRSTLRRPSATLPVSYSIDALREGGSVLAAMFLTCGLDPAAADFRLPIPASWREKAWARINAWQPDRPLLIYRPLVERTEWGGCAVRNPDHAAYAKLFRQIRERFFVVSVADLVPGVEWITGEPIDADVTCHAGELDIETLAALTAEAALTFASPGFATILAQAVGTPSVTVFGGYEDGRSFMGGARFAPHLPIEPDRPCACFRHDCACDKKIDLKAAGAALEAFIHANAVRSIPQPPIFGGRPIVRPTEPVAPASCDLTGLPTRYVNPGELERLIALVRSVSPRVMIEIGCNSGRTAKAVLRNVPSLERYVGIDVPPGYAFAKSVQAREVPPRPGEMALDDPRFRLLLARRGSFDLTAEDLPGCDVVFVDGDHGAEAVRRDHALARQLVRPGGIIIHHDDHDLGNVDVRDVLDALHTPERPIVHVAGTWLAFERAPGWSAEAALAAE